MKKRILAMLLLLAMILTMVPVIASADEVSANAEGGENAASEGAEGATLGDLHEWYVQDGLTALYSTFGENNGVDLAAGTWTSKVGSGVATLGVKDRWSVGEYGGIGYTVLYGTVAEDGSYVVDSAYNNHNTTDLALKFGLSQLNNGDFTVDYMAMHKPLYVANAEGDILTVDGAKVESYDAFGEKQLPDGMASSKETPIDKLGWLSSWSNRIDDDFWKGGRGELYWIYNQTRWYDSAGGTTNGDRLQVFTMGDPLKTNSVINTYSMWLDETVTTTPAEEEGAEDVTVTAAHFQLFRNGAYYAGTHFSTANNGVAGKTAVQWHDAGTAFRSGLGFSLSHASPVDFFSVRIYNRPLETAEMIQNRAVDVLLYYGIELTAEQVADKEFKEAAITMASGFGFEKDATVKAKTAGELSDALANAQKARDVVKMYAAGENLTAFYTTFIDGTLNIEAGTWTDLVGGGVATMGVPSRWFVNANGSFGYNAYAGYLKDDGTKSMGGNVNDDRTAIAALGNVPTANSAYYKNNALTFGMDKLPTEDFTVEYLAMYKPLYVADASKSTKDNLVYAKSASGDLIEAYDLFGKTPSTTDYGSIQGRAIDSIGHLTTITTHIDGTTGWGPGCRGTQHYLYGTHAWNQTRVWVGSGTFNATSGLAVKGDPYKQNGVVVLYAITLEETTAEDGTVSGNFGLYRNGTLYNESKGVLTGGSYKADFDDKSEFYLSACQPTDFYAVRVYNKVLTPAEEMRNMAVDALLYYDIELAPEVLADAEKMEAIYAIASGFDIVTDATQIAINKAKLNNAVDRALNSAEVLDINKTLYVKDGLTALFTAFEKDVLYSVGGVGGDKVWVNRVKDGASATFKGGDVWKIGDFGGVSKTYIRGTMTGGVFSKDNNTSTPNTSDSADYSLYFGLDMLPKEDFTLEYLAYFPPLYAVDTETGDLVAHYNGGYTEAYYAVDKIGFLEFCSVYPGGTLDKMNNYVRGRIAPKACSAWSGVNGGGTYGFGGTAFRIERDSLRIDSYAVMRDETTVYGEDGTTVEEVKANYFTAYNGAIAHQLLDFSTKYPEYWDYEKGKNLSYQGYYENATTYKGGKYYDYEDDTSFYLSKYTGATFYAVRIYNRTLTEAEMTQNRIADLVGYYDLSVPEVIAKEPDQLAKLGFGDAVLESDYVAVAANRARYQEEIDELAAIISAKEICDYASYYVQDHLVALYTAFAGDTSVNIMNGVWENRVENGADATLKGNWKKRAFGIGYSILSSDYKTVANSTGVILSDDYAALPTFTVEAFANVIGVTNADGTRYVNDYKPQIKDDAGNVIDPGQGRQYGWYTTGASAFRFDMLNSLFFASYDCNTPLQSLASRWYLMNQAYEDSGLGNHLKGKVDAFKAILLDVETGWSVPSATTYMPKLMEVVRTTDADKNEFYSISYDGVTVKTGEMTPEDRATLEANTVAEESRFHLFTALPAVVYAIRVYSDTLTPAEKLQNSFVDKAAYYGLDLTGFKEFDDAKKTKLYNAFAKIGFGEDADSVKAIYDFYAKSDVQTIAGKLVSFDKYLPILSGANGYRVLFRLNTASVALLKAGGYSVAYGALVAPGGKYNTVENVTLDNANATKIAVGGEGGSGIYYNLAGAGSYSYSAAVTADNSAYFGVDMIVRGYVQITDAEGNVTTKYIDVYQNEMLDGEVSILTAADYFVNDFDGDVATQYKYMNSAALRGILAAHGYASRVALDSDLTLYVNAASGNDENNGLSVDTAYKTIQKAFAAAKAHFGKSGVKNVTIRLAAGTYTITEPLTLDGADILADAYSFSVVGAGKDTVLTSLVEIDHPTDEDMVVYDEETGAQVVQIPADENGAYPALRGVYGDGKLLQITHVGDGDNFGVIQQLDFVDAEGNILPKDTEETPEGKEIWHEYNKDWALTAYGASLAKYAVYRLPLDKIKQDESAYAGAELHHTQAWTFHTAIIDHMVIGDEYAEAYVLTGHLPANYYKGYNVSGCAFWIENTKELMYENGDTYYYEQSTGKLYYRSDNVSIHEFDSLAYAAAENLIVLNDVANVTFDGITFTGVDAKHLTMGGSISMGQAGRMSITRPGAEKVSVGFPTSGAIYGMNVSDFTVKNSVFNEMTGGGINLRGISENITVDSSVFTNLGDSAIRVGSSEYTATSYTKGLYITNNYVNNVATLYKASVAIQSFAVANAKIVGNTVMNVSYSAFSFGWIWSTIDATADSIVQGGQFSTFNMEIAYNYITDFMTCMGDGGAFYLLGGNVKRSANDPGYYNFMHHNYVNMSQATGDHVHNGVINTDSKRFTMGYYHDNSSSHWLDSENVLVNTSTGTFSTYWLQTYEGGETHSIKLVDNYLIGVNKDGTGKYNLSEIYVDNKAINNELYVYANDYIYADVAALKANTSIGVQTYGDAVTKESKATAATDVAAIFAAAGSSLAPEDVQVSGLDWTADAVEREVLMDAEYADVTSGETVTVTFTDGETTAAVVGVAGAGINAPLAFRDSGCNYVFKVDGKEIDLNTYKLPENDVTVEVETVVITYKLTLTDENEYVEVLELAAGEKIVLPASMARAGYKTTVKWYSTELDLDTFEMPAQDLSLKVSYTIQKYKVTITDGKTTVSITEAYGTTLPAQAKNFVKFGHVTKFSVGGVDIVDGGYKIPDGDVTINVRYELANFNAKFYSIFVEGEETVHANVSTTFGTAIVAPANPADFDMGGYHYSFTGWTGYTEGMILETEGASFLGKWDITANEYTVKFVYTIDGVATEVDSRTVTFGEAIGAAPALPASFEQDGYLYTFTGWEGYTEGMTLTEEGMTFEAIYEKTVIPTGIVGDINGDGFVNVSDVVAVISAASGETLDPEQYPGATDLNGDGFVNVSDIVAVISLASGSTAE